MTQQTTVAAQVKAAMDTITKIVVHGGIFHADDTLCVAMMKALKPDVQVERAFKITDEMATDETIIICDIGGGRYDHHQADAERRDDGNKFAACGLFFRDFGELLFPRKENREKFLRTYILPLEDADNGVNNNPLSSYIHSLNGGWDATEEQKANGFKKAVDLFSQIICEEQNIMKGEIAAEVLVAEALEQAKEGICVLKQYLPSDMFIGTGATFLISPSMRGGYQLLTVKKQKGSFEDVISLPEEWLETKPEGCTFVHQARFIASFETEEQAVTAAREIK